MSQKLVVVLGGTGDIGSALVRELKNSGYRYLAPSSVQVDLTNAFSTEAFFSTVSEPYLLVFAAFLDRRRGDNEETFELNSQMINNVVLFGRPSSVVFLSSMDIYGKCPKLPIAELNELDRVSFYSRAKLFAESQLAERFGGKMPLLVLRLPGVYGGYGPRNSALDRIIAQGVRTGVIDIGKGGHLLRDWVFADDVARFVVGFDTISTSGTFNFATGQSISIDQYVSECLLEIKGVQHYVCSIDGSQNSDAGFDHIFNVEQLNLSFPDWKFQCRTASLLTFSRRMLKHLKVQ